MLFFLFLTILVIGIIICIICDKSYKYDWAWFQSIGGVCYVIGGIAVIISLFIFMFEYTGVNGYIAKMDARKESLVYQMENDLYSNDNDLGKKDLYGEIQEYNESIASAQRNEKDLWLGIYYVNIYDQFELIELNGGAK